MPKAFESFDFSHYDLVIASSSCCAKGVITPPTVPFIAYIHSPMRYAWDLYFDYYAKSKKITRFFMKKQMPKIREWDFISSQRIDFVVANSFYISRRIKKFWGRDSQVIYPPVNTAVFKKSNNAPKNFYLAFSRFVPYKRIDLAISACGELKRPLVVIGGGSQEKQLKTLASKYQNITFTGRISDEALGNYLNSCKALLFCAEEDFGIIPVEVQAAGRPVIAFKKGGAKETVVERKTGIFFEEQTVESLKKAILKFEDLDKNGVFSPNTIALHAQKFSTERFKTEFSALVKNAIQMTGGGKLSLTKFKIRRTNFYRRAI